MPSAQGVDTTDAWGSLATLVVHLVLRELEPASLAALCQEDVLTVLDKLEPGCGDYLAGRTWEPADFDEAAADYCDVFILGKKTAPYASAWLSGDPLVNGPRLAVRVSEVATSLGLDPAVLAELPPDHLGVLLSLVIEAWQRRPELADDLVDELLASWVPALGEALQSHSRSPLYRALGSLMRQLVTWRQTTTVDK